MTALSTGTPGFECFAIEEWDHAQQERVRRDGAPGFEFFQLVRLLERIQQGGWRVGHAPQPAQESIRFRSRVSFTFPASDVQSLSPPQRPGDPCTLFVNFLGLASPGVMGSLPSWYARAILNQESSDASGPERSTALRDFLDLFNHRLISFFFRAFEKHDLPYQYEAWRDGTLHRMLFSFLGLGLPSLRNRLRIDDRALLFHAGILARRPVTAAGLEEILRDYFGLPIRVEPFVAEAFELEPGDRLRVGDRGARLGKTTFLGTYVRLTQAKFRLHIGPLVWDQYRNLLPEGSMFLPLVDLVRLAVGPEFEFDAQLILDKRHVPALRLQADSPARLGWSSWLGRRLVPVDATDAILPLSRLGT